MKMKRIGITGQNGFVGTHLYNTLGLLNEKYTRVNFKKSFFGDDTLLDKFVQECDVIVHLAGMNRHQDPEVIYETNIHLAEKLIAAIKRTQSNPHIIFSSSSQEEKDNPYGRSKKEARLKLQTCAEEQGGIFTGLIIPNVFGPFGKPYYNSVIATFSHQLNHGETPKIEVDADLNLLYVDELVQQILQIIDDQPNSQAIKIPHSTSCSVSEILNLLMSFKENYLDHGKLLELNSTFELNLFNTFRSFIDLKNHYPANYHQHTDDRGAFTELIRSEIGGQVSFSTTKSGITRGNHFHTRKIERFAVIKGKARIQLRKIGTDELIEFELDGNEPAFVDMPIWYTHNITNVGNEELYTVFWINEAFDPANPDTYFEIV
jgi:UDP-2-acetamido-2,6-beta-L-arabino-hexul-4-ose reductase